MRYGMTIFNYDALEADELWGVIWGRYIYLDHSVSLSALGFESRVIAQAGLQKSSLLGSGVHMTRRSSSSTNFRHRSRFRTILSRLTDRRFGVCTPET